MTEKRFTTENKIKKHDVGVVVLESDLKDMFSNGKFPSSCTTCIHDNGKDITIEDCCDLLNNLWEEINEQHETIKQLKQKITELELLNDSLNYALKYIKKIDVEIDVGDVE